MSYLKINVSESFTEPLRKQLEQAGKGAALTVATQVLTDTEPFVPARTLSTANRTQVKGAEEEKHLSDEAMRISKQNINRGIPVIIYPGPYARYLYFGVKMVNEKTGKGPMHFFDKMGNEVIMFPKGSRLTKTSELLDIKKSTHPQATAFWFEESKKQNIKKWEDIARKAVAKYFGK